MASLTAAPPLANRGACSSALSFSVDKLFCLLVSFSSPFPQLTIVPVLHCRTAASKRSDPDWVWEHQALLWSPDAIAPMRHFMLRMLHDKTIPLPGDVQVLTGGPPCQVSGTRAACLGACFTSWHCQCGGLCCWDTACDMPLTQQLCLQCSCW